MQDGILWHIVTKVDHAHAQEGLSQIPFELGNFAVFLQDARLARKQGDAALPLWKAEVSQHLKSYWAGTARLGHTLDLLTSAFLAAASPGAEP